MLKRWASQHGAARALGLTSAGGISNVANVRGQAARGFRWRFASRSDEAVSSGDSARRDDSRGTAPGTVSVAAVAATQVAPLGSTQDDDGDPRPPVRPRKHPRVSREEAVEVAEAEAGAAPIPYHCHNLASSPASS